MRNFALVDQDQSDNVITTYLINGERPDRAEHRRPTRRHSPAPPPSSTAATTGCSADFVDPANGCTRVHRDRHDRRGRRLRLAGPQRAERPGQPDRDHRGRPAERRDDPGQRRATASPRPTSTARWSTSRCWPATPTPPTVAAGYCQNLVNIAPARNQLDMTRDAELRLAGPGHRQQPGHVPGQPAAASFVHPGLRQLRPDRPGQRHPGRRRRGHRDHLQADPAEGDHPGRGRRHRHADRITVRFGRNRAALVRRAASPSPAPSERHRHVATALDGPARSAVRTMTKRPQVTLGAASLCAHR